MLAAIGAKVTSSGGINHLLAVFNAKLTYRVSCYHPVMEAKSQQPTSAPGGANLAHAPGLNMVKVQALLSTPTAFPSMCRIVREDESAGYMSPTPTQTAICEAYDDHNWLIVNKFRQAKVTTIAVMLLLRDCMYLSGVKGLLIAERQGTAEDVFERILFAYHSLPEDVRMPLAPNRRAGATQIHFCHGGNIKILTTGGRSPAIGRSIDRLVITEFGESKWQRKAAINIFPTMNKRPNAKVVLESTPGRAGSHHEQMWHSALEGKGRFHPLFFNWWEDSSCRIEDGNFRPKSSEFEYLSDHVGMDVGNLAFRRAALETEFGGDSRLFTSKYPSGPYDGWLGAYAPIMPVDVLKPWLDHAVADPVIGIEGCHEIDPPDKASAYLITADPAGFGAAGDKSALTVWDAIERREVAFWEDRESPDRFARRLMTVQARYNTALLAVESNAAACIAVLKDMGCRNMLWTDRNHPGWYATNKRVQESEARLVKMLSDKEIEIRSRGMLHQLVNYDGSRKKRVKGLDGTTHHFDRARTAVMAADILSRRHFTKTRLEEGAYTRVAGQVTIADLDRSRRVTSDAAKNPFKPPPRDWM